MHKKERTTHKLIDFLCIVRNNIPMRSSLGDKWNYLKAKELVRLSGYTRKHIAEQIGIKPSTLNQILSGKYPSRQTVKLLAQVLNCKEGDLILGELVAS